MTDDDPWAGLRRWHRREYLRQHEKQRRAGLKAARRIGVTLRGKALDHYATVRRYVEGLNQLREADDKAAKQGLVPTFGG